MFCARCGKEIDNDSTFCPFCGQKTDEPVERGGGGPKPGAPAKKPGKKVIRGIAAVVVVLLVIFGITKVIGGISQQGRSLSEKLFAMSWEEISEISESDFRHMLEDEGTLYRTDSAEDSSLGIKSIKTKTTESFMGGDCLYLHAPDAFVTIYGVRYETEEDFKAGREQIEEILEKSLLRNTAAYEEAYGGLQMKWYPVGVSDKNLDLDTITNLIASYGLDDMIELDEEELSELSQYHMYKFALVAFGNQNDMSQITDEFVFPGDKSYTNNMCRLMTVYVPMREEDLISSQAVNGGYDVISGEKIEIDKFKESVSEDLVDAYLDEHAPEDPERRREWKEELYIRLYMMEKHKFDTDNSIYLKTEDEKRLWYIRNFNWDTDTDAPVDLSGYRDSGSIYCAVECNYNSDTAEYFESELDRALYLADKNYKADTGESFGSTEEERLWFMENYSYDTSSGKEMDKEVVDALIAYQKYIDEDRLNPYPEYGEMDVNGFTLAYIDDDIVPECVILSDNSGIFVMSYKNGEIQSVAPEEYYTLDVSVWYTPRFGTFAIDSWYGNHEREWDVIELKDSFNKTSVLDRVNDYENGIVYTLNGQVVSKGGDDDSYGDHYLDQFNFEEEVLHATPVTDDEYRNVHDSLLAAYDALRTTIYETYEYSIYEYELKDGILTVKADDGAAVADGFGTCQPFEFSYPIADDCIWEAGNGFGEYRTEYTYLMTPEELEVEIKNWRDQYDLTPNNLESPVAIQFHVIDERVVGVYTSAP